MLNVWLLRLHQGRHPEGLNTKYLGYTPKKSVWSPIVMYDSKWLLLEIIN